MRIIITNHFLCVGWAFDVAHFRGLCAYTIGGSRFYFSQYRVLVDDDVADKINPDLEEPQLRLSERGGWFLSATDKKG